MLDPYQHTVFRHLDRPTRIGPWTVSEFFTLLLAILAVAVACYATPLYWGYKFVFASVVIALIYLLLKYAQAKNRTPWKMVRVVWGALRTPRRYVPAKGQSRLLVLTAEQVQEDEEEL